MTRAQQYLCGTNRLRFDHEDDIHTHVYTHTWHDIHTLSYIKSRWYHSYLCGFDMTATTAMPDAVRTGFALSIGTRIDLYTQNTFRVHIMHCTVYEAGSVRPSRTSVRLIILPWGINGESCIERDASGARIEWGGNLLQCTSIRWITPCWILCNSFWIGKHNDGTVHIGRAILCCCACRLHTFFWQHFCWWREFVFHEKSIVISS